MNTINYSITTGELMVADDALTWKMCFNQTSY